GLAGSCCFSARPGPQRHHARPSFPGGRRADAAPGRNQVVCQAVLHRFLIPHQRTYGEERREEELCGIHACRVHVHDLQDQAAWCHPCCCAEAAAVAACVAPSPWITRWRTFSNALVSSWRTRSREMLNSPASCSSVIGSSDSRRASKMRRSRGPSTVSASPS